MPPTAAATLLLTLSAAQEYLAQQAAVRAEHIEVQYSYWDGQGHRRRITVRKGDTIQAFLKAVRDQLSPTFKELRMTSVDNLMFVKEDIILPHHCTFYDLIVNKVRGKSGPLFEFSIREDVRLVADATVEKADTHAGKVRPRPLTYHSFTRCNCICDVLVHAIPIYCHCAVRHPSCCFNIPNDDFLPDVNPMQPPPPPGRRWWSGTGTTRTGTSSRPAAGRCWTWTTWRTRAGRTRCSSTATRTRNDAPRGVKHSTQQPIANSE